MAHIRRRHKADCAQRENNAKRCNCNGSWQARYTDPSRGGTHKIERTFRTKQEAEDWLTLQRSGVLQGTHVDPRQSDRPFNDVLTAWRESWSGRLSPTTERRYTSILNNYLVPEFGATPIGRITHEAVQRYVNRLAAAVDAEGKPEHAPGTVRNVYAVLRTAMAKGVRLNMVKVNPCLNVDLPRARREEMLFLTADEVRAVAEKIDGHYRVLIYTAAYTGLRAGELGGLQRGDVDLLRGVIHVRRALKDVNGRLELGPTKTHAQRTVSLPTFLRDMLRDHLSADTLGGTGPDAYVFTLKGGGPLRHGQVYGRYFRRAVAGWKDARGVHHPGALPERLHGLRFHDLRHTCAALSIAAGAHPKLIASRLGHSTIQITLDRYGHLFPSVEESLAEALDAAFAAESGDTTNVTALKAADEK
jgi:integrase